jgi:hypothetical protein
LYHNPCFQPTYNVTEGRKELDETGPLLSHSPTTDLIGNRKEKLGASIKNIELLTNITGKKCTWPSGLVWVSLK